jgi:uncharacterized membrane protein YcaP (DUF421 family)
VFEARDMDRIEEAVRLMLGVGVQGEQLDAVQMGLRAVVVYVVTVFIVRLGKKRFMGATTAFDVILGIMLGSTASRAITGSAPLIPALAASAVLLAMHWVFSATAMRFSGFGWAIKGGPATLVRGGEIDWKTMRKVHVTEDDLMQDLRSKGVSDLKDVAEVRMERSGQLSIVKAHDPEARFADLDDQVSKLAADMAAVKRGLGELTGKVEALPRILADRQARPR